MSAKRNRSYDERKAWFAAHPWAWEFRNSPTKRLPHTTWHNGIPVPSLTAYLGVK